MEKKLTVTSLQHFSHFTAVPYCSNIVVNYYSVVCKLSKKSLLQKLSLRNLPETYRV